MAQVASWHAPMGDKFGSKNDCQEPHNTDNYNEQLRFNKTVGYFKPPFCSWPRGGYSKKETKSRIKTGEPVVKAGSFEIDGNDFHMRRGAFAPEKSIVFAGTKDEDEISIRTASTTLYMNSNLQTRTFFSNKRPMELPGKYHRAKFDLTSKNLGVIPEQFVRCHDDSTAQVFTCFGTGEGPTGADGTLQSTQKLSTDLMFTNESQMADAVYKQRNTAKVLKPTDPKSLEEQMKEASAEDSPRTRAHEPPSTTASRLMNPRYYSTGKVPRMEERYPEPEVPTWRKDWIAAADAKKPKRIAQPANYQKKEQLRLKKSGTVAEGYEPNEQFLYYD